MFVRRKTVRYGERSYTYEHVVRSVRVNGKVRQEVLASLGRINALNVDEKAELIRVLRRLAGEDVPEQPKQARRSRAAVDPELGETRSFGDICAIEDAWRALGLDGIVGGLARDRKQPAPDFNLERAVFAMVANRLCDPRSKYGVADWLWRDVYLPTGVPLDADQLYKTLTWLAERQSEAELLLYRRLVADKKIDASAVFYDTTTTWFEGRGPTDLAQWGRPHGTHPPKKRLILVGLVRSLNGWPIAHHLFPGNTGDIETVEKVLRDLRDRFGIQRCIFICDRGMISDDVIALLEQLHFEYVIATKLRGDKEVRDDILARPGRYHEVDEQLGVKEVGTYGFRRYVVCRNPVEVEGDAARRQEIVATLRTKHLDKPVRADTKKGKKLVTTPTFGRYLSEVDGLLVIDPKKVEGDKRYDGKWVLRTNLDGEKYPAAEVARLYKLEAGIEKDFRDIKSFIELRPVYHHLDARVRAHVFICVLAKVVARELERRLHAAQFIGTSIEAVLAELSHIKVVEVGEGDRACFVRTRISAEHDALLRRLEIDPRSLPTRLPTYARERPRRTRLDNVEMERRRQDRKRRRHEEWLRQRSAQGGKSSRSGKT